METEEEDYSEEDCESDIASVSTSEGQCIHTKKNIAEIKIECC